MKVKNPTPLSQIGWFFEDQPVEDWAIEVASENDRSLASFGPAAQKAQ